MRQCVRRMSRRTNLFDTALQMQIQNHLFIIFDRIHSRKPAQMKKKTIIGTSGKNAAVFRARSK